MVNYSQATDKKRKNLTSVKLTPLINNTTKSPDNILRESNSLECSIKASDMNTIDVHNISAFDLNTPLKKEMTISEHERKEDQELNRDESHSKLYNSLLAGVSKSREDKVSNFKTTNRRESKRNKLPKIDDSLNITPVKKNKRHKNYPGT